MDSPAPRGTSSCRCASSARSRRGSAGRGLLDAALRFASPQGRHKHNGPVVPEPGLMRTLPPANVSSPWPGLLIGGLLGLISLPLVWVFVDRLLDPGPRDERDETLIGLAIAIGFAALAWGAAFARHRVAVDGAAQT